MKATPLKMIANLMGLQYEGDRLVTGAAIDSRLVNADDLFFALYGENVDGHTFLKQAAEKGATAAVVHNSYAGEAFGMPLLKVKNVAETLQNLARTLLAKRSSTVIAITGTIGKTTTKTFLKTLLLSKYKVYASPKSYNTQLTVPMSILNAYGDEDFLILEMGMSEPGQIKKLVSIAPPDIALLTMVGVQHATDFPDGLAGIAREKAAIFSHEKTTLGILHYDMPHFNDAASTGSCAKQTFSTLTKQADYALIDEGGEWAVFSKKEKRAYPIFVQLPMRELYHNFLAAAVVARAVDVSWEEISTVAPKLTLPPMRFEKVERGKITFINDAYNANPQSMIAALNNLPKPLPGRKTIAVLGDMDALANYAEKSHAQVVEHAVGKTDVLLCLGSRWPNQQSVEIFAEKGELTSYLKEIVMPGDVVLLKGARSHALEEILGYF